MGRDHEIIIAGAGPAGALTAALLAARGRDVLLLDKSSFPRHKACGNALPAGVSDILVEAGLRDQVEEAFLRGEFYPVERARLVSPRGHHLVTSLSKSKRGYSPCVSNRYFFDHLLQQYALRAGALFKQLKVEKPEIENGHVTGVQVSGKEYSGQIRAGIVVDAEGVNSALGRVLRGTNRHLPAHRAVAARAYIEDIRLTPREVEFYLYKDILPGYAWIFPCGENRANIGLGMRLDYYRRSGVNLKDMLMGFMGLPAIEKRLVNCGKVSSIASWPLNFGSQKNLQYAFNGALLVGDAAGFINPLTGGGIHASLVSALLAAQVIDEALKRGDTSKAGLQQYERMCRDLILKDLRKSYYLQEVLLRFPFLLDFMAGPLHKNRAAARAISRNF